MFLCIYVFFLEDRTTKIYVLSYYHLLKKYYYRLLKSIP